jgi:hypothetical protein
MVGDLSGGQSGVNPRVIRQSLESLDFGAVSPFAICSDHPESRRLHP